MNLSFEHNVAIDLSSRSFNRSRWHCFQSEHTWVRERRFQRFSNQFWVSSIENLKKFNLFAKIVKKKKCQWKWKNFWGKHSEAYSRRKLTCCTTGSCIIIARGHSRPNATHDPIHLLILNCNITSSTIASSNSLYLDSLAIGTTCQNFQGRTRQNSSLKKLKFHSWINLQIMAIAEKIIHGYCKKFYFFWIIFMYS